MKRTLMAMTIAITLGCGGGGSDGETTTTADTTATSGSDTGSGSGGETAGSARPQLTEAECTAQGGSLVGDIGDGATQRADYVCPNGRPPLGTVASGIEGSACCGG